MRGKHSKRAALRREQEALARLDQEGRRREELAARVADEVAEEKAIAELNSETAGLRELLRLRTLAETTALKAEIEGLRLEIGRLEEVEKGERARRDQDFVVGRGNLGATEEVIAKLRGGDEPATVGTGVYQRLQGGADAARLIQRARGIRGRASLDEARVQVRSSLERLVPTIEGEGTDEHSSAS